MEVSSDADEPVGAALRHRGVGSVGPDGQQREVHANRVAAVDWRFLGVNEIDDRIAVSLSSRGIMSSS